MLILLHNSSRSCLCGSSVVHMAHVTAWALMTVCLCHTSARLACCRRRMIGRQALVARANSPASAPLCRRCSSHCGCRAAVFPSSACSPAAVVASHCQPLSCIQECCRKVCTMKVGLHFWFCSCGAAAVSLGKSACQSAGWGVGRCFAACCLQVQPVCSWPLYKVHRRMSVEC